MKLPFGVSQYTTGPQSFARDLALLRRLGIGHIELCESKLSTTNPHPQLRQVQAAGLDVSSVQPRYHSPFPNSLRAVPASPRDRMARLRQSVRLFASYFPGTTLVVNTGLAPGGDLATAWKVAIREFQAIASFAAAHGVRIGFEPLNPVYMNTDTFICSLAHAGRLIDAVDHDKFGLFLDVWHYWEDPAAAALIRRYRNKIFGVHISDWRTPRAFGDRRLPGQGEMPLADLLRTIRRCGYEGVYTLEIFSDRRLEDSLWAHPARTVAAGRKSFTQLWRKVCA